MGFRVGLRVWARVRVRARCLRLRGPRVVLLEARGAAEILVGLLALRVYARARGVPDALDARRTRGLRHLHGGRVGGCRVRVRVSVSVSVSVRVRVRVRPRRRGLGLGLRLARAAMAGLGARTLKEIMVELKGQG